MSAARPLRVVVAGTGFGRVYLTALAAAGGPFELAGVLANGSDYSRQCAREYGAPLYTDPAQVPDDIDIVCVVVRSAATGGAGSQLAQQFLRRGLHVLQEHPVHHSEIAACLQAAREGDAAYAVNTLHPNLAPVRRFLAVARYLRERQRLHYIDAASNSQMIYPVLDLIGRAAGGLRPWSFGEPLADSPAHPFRSLHGSVNGVPLSLRVQNQVHPEDPDNHSLLLGQVSLGCDAGVLILPDLHGPVLWNARLHSPRDHGGRLLMRGPGSERLAVASTQTLGAIDTGDYHHVFADVWPGAVIYALHELRRDIADPARRRRAGQWALSVSQAWRDLTGRIGLPELIRPDEPQALPLAELIAAAHAGDDDGADDASATAPSSLRANPAPSPDTLEIL
ncbi:Gfo/Idh/MocA family oxidoreductase [Pseudomonas sp. CGJS7]|uniref:Gfo/Idh/MocA family oxidoreductase n=1 Tax=Pseudomonas sp. CGJS7 TaxID=3109348 RepID=UPI00300AB096